ncbi:uncharacterized protein EKO05_0006389 [Ascochyta rabiei]|uniref:uncharacterized protein n=1 Tax=Didymella rabiei TaxID=5454 RepID=UPI0022046543|nr:uncharacterized protein EKO05_0006389 [Ascochyta rabiei]UPX15959.1 hypothetical protein EKO05_0006389 [Ascochyta rabiei]
MDARPPAPPSTCPPDRPLIRHPNHQPSTAHAFAGYPPSTQPQPPQPQPQQPQQPLHVPFSTSTDPYASPRRDPFHPQTSHHARHRSHGAPESASQAYSESDGGWESTARTARQLVQLASLAGLETRGSERGCHLGEAPVARFSDDAVSAHRTLGELAKAALCTS